MNEAFTIWPDVPRMFCEHYHTRTTCPTKHCIYCRLIGPHPNTYTFTKRLAERLVSNEFPNIPLVIVRPSIGKSFVNGRPEPQARAHCLNLQCLGRRDVRWRLLYCVLFQRMYRAADLVTNSNAGFRFSLQ
jgi:hypothetical protein